jgi:EmrB/QacA subfamily drug resistance transporter
MFKQEIKKPDSKKTKGIVQITSVNWVLVSLSLPMLLSSLGTSIANVSLPTLAEAFNASFQQVQWVVIAYLLSITTLVVTIGRLGDMVGRRKLLLIGILLFTGASAICGVAPSLWLLIVARAAQGLGAAAMMALTLTFVGETVPKEKIGSAMGLLGTMSAIGTALGPSLGGILIAGLGWRSIFLVNLPLGIFTFLLAKRYLPADLNVRISPAAGFDYAGTLLLALTIGAFALAMTVGRGNFGTINLALLALATGSVLVFIRIEARTTEPLIQMVMFRNRVLTSSLIMSVLVATVMMATLVVGPFYLARALELETALVGLAMSVGPVVATFSGVPVGRTTDRFGAQRITIAGLVLMLFGTLAIAAIPTNFGVLGYLAPLVITTVGYMLFQTANNTSVMAKLKANQRGVISGMLSLSRNLGLIMGASLMGAIFAFASATTDVTSAPPSAIATGMRVTFFVAATLIAIALAVAVNVTKKIQP